VGKAGALSKMSCAKSNFRGETGLSDHCFVPGLAGTGAPSKGAFVFLGLVISSVTSRPVRLR
jgi:hypothetical protein